jgi:uncharacterized repeat protein (TIGR03803 family)
MRLFRSASIVIGVAFLSMIGTRRVEAQAYVTSGVASFDGANGINPGTAIQINDYPVAGLTIDGSGNLFGTAQAGGLNATGTVFELPFGSNAIVPLASFAHETSPQVNTNGSDPSSVLVMDSHGNLFGTTEYGGANGAGTVFEIPASSFNVSNPTANTATILTLATFNGTNGSTPVAGLAIDASGNLYGTTAVGGANSSGTVFELPSTGGGTYGSLSTLASFNGSTGTDPLSSMSFFGGNLYGTAQYGGVSGAGTVFEVSNLGGTAALNAVASFGVTDSGANPIGGVVFDGSGNIYGTTSAGGTNGSGTVFELTGGSITTLASFDAANFSSPNANNTGDTPTSGLLIDSHGNLYGTTSEGGLGSSGGGGTVYEVTSSSFNASNPTANSATITPLANLGAPGGDPNLGLFPNGPLVFDSSGDLFDTAQFGGATNPGNGGDGTIFELSPSSQSNPQLPNTAAAGTFTFENVPNGSWFDPPYYPSITYNTTAGALFTEILGFPSGYGPMDVTANGHDFGDFTNGQTLDFTTEFPGGVSSFTISGISPLVDFGNTSSFPLQLQFNQAFASFTMVGEQSATATPEPSTLVGAVFGTLGLLLAVWRQRRLAV